ncbi:hypothetical protein SynRS9902_02270 [Synechococcus sp. RS9902]|nr:hypothetical protein SynRS9902_02270 [Synechococcus sp. RS9902]
MQKAEEANKQAGESSIVKTRINEMLLLDRIGKVLCILIMITPKSMQISLVSINCLCSQNSLAVRKYIFIQGGLMKERTT